MHYYVFCSKKCHKNQPKKQESAISFSFVFLSLILCVLCFFIYLVQNSTFEKVKIDALKTSLQHSFSYNVAFFQKNLPSFEASQLAIYYQNTIAKVFPLSEIKQNLINDEVSIFIPISVLFKETDKIFSSKADIFFNQIKNLLDKEFIQRKYVMDFILFEDLISSQSYPVYEHITTQRLEKVDKKMAQHGILAQNYSVGIEKGEADFFKLHFRRRRDK